jgi:hypothetical protein
VPYITSPGKRVRTVVTDLGVLEKRGPMEEGRDLVLTGVFPDGETSREVLARRAVERCGWELRVAEDLALVPPATEREISLLRLFDPRRQFLGKKESA